MIERSLDSFSEGLHNGFWVMVTIAAIVLFVNMFRMLEKLIENSW